MVGLELWLKCFYVHKFEQLHCSCSGYEKLTNDLML